MTWIVLPEVLTAIQASMAQADAVGKASGLTLSEIKIELPLLVQVKGAQVTVQLPNPDAGVSPDAAYLSKVSFAVTPTEESASPPPAGSPAPSGTAPGSLITGTAEPLYGLWSSPLGAVYAVGAVGLLLRAAPGDKAFTPLSSGTAERLHSICGEGSTLVAVGRAGTICLSTDDGQTFESFTLGKMVASPAGPVTLNGVCFAGGRWIAVGAKGRILASDDGMTWFMVDSTTNINLHAVWGTPDGVVYAVGTQGAVLVSKDGGMSWAWDHDGGPDLFAVWGPSADEVYAVGAKGFILRRTPDQGWQQVPSPTKHHLYSIGGTASQIVVAGRGGALLVNQGQGWSKLTSGTTEALHAVARRASGELCAVGTLGTALRIKIV